jgi:predicted RNase H-like nuclease
MSDTHCSWVYPMKDEQHSLGSDGISVARYIATRAGPVERLALIGWAQGMLQIRETNLPLPTKAKKAVRLTLRSEVMAAILKVYGAPLKKLAWDDRSWPMRIGTITAAATAGVASSEGAGIAALGGAIGVPLWVVLGAGGTFASVLIQELTAATKDCRSEYSQSERELIPPAEYTVLPNSREALPAARKELAAEWNALRPALGIVERTRPARRFARIRLRASAALSGVRRRAADTMPKRRELYIGVDGCSAGWFSIAIDTDGRSWISVDDDFTSLLDRWPKARNILVDIPVGLPSATAERMCDAAARRLLGDRRSSVFPAPARAALAAVDYREASAANKQITGRGLSKQAWNICEKIRQVDDALHENKKLSKRIREVHPELLFWALNGKKSLVHYKKSDEGEEERLAILESYLPAVRDLYTSARRVYSKAIVAPDDILDAMAAAVTGLIGRGEYQSLPDYVESDERGVRMEMVYVIPEMMREVI